MGGVPAAPPVDPGHLAEDMLGEVLWSAPAGIRSAAARLPVVHAFLTTPPADPATATPGSADGPERPTDDGQVIR